MFWFWGSKFNKHVAVRCRWPRAFLHSSRISCFSLRDGPIPSRPVPDFSNTRLKGKYIVQNLHNTIYTYQHYDAPTNIPHHDFIKMSNN